MIDKTSRKFSKKGRGYYKKEDLNIYVTDNALMTPPIEALMGIAKNLESTYGTIATGEMLAHILDLLDSKINTRYEVRIDEEY